MCLLWFFVAWLPSLTLGLLTQSLLSHHQRNNRRKDSAEESKSNRHTKKRFQITRLTFLLHQLRPHNRQEQTEIEAGKNRVRYGDGNAGLKALTKGQRIAVCYSSFFDSQHQAHDCSEVENSDIRELSIRTFKVQHKMFQRHPRGDYQRDTDSVLQGDLH